MRRAPLRRGAFLLALLASMVLSAPAAAEEPTGAVPVIGRWTGAKLRCQKEETKLVRCGTPAPFEITFTAEGTGTTVDESLPRQFTWRWLTAKELGLTPTAGGDEVKLFGVESEEGSLTFQAYVFLPVTDANAPPEARYIHFVFDVTKAE